MQLKCLEAKREVKRKKSKHICRKGDKGKHFRETSDNELHLLARPIYICIF